MKEKQSLVLFQDRVVPRHLTNLTQREETFVSLQKEGLSYSPIVTIHFLWMWLLSEVA